MPEGDDLQAKSGPPPEVLEGSRFQPILFFVFCLAFAGASPFLFTSGNYPSVFKAWLGSISGLVGAVLAGCAAIRPYKMVLDSEGFTLSGGLMRRPSRETWASIKRFRVVTLLKGGPRAGYDYWIPSKMPDGVQSGQSLGLDAAIPGAWKLEPEDLVARLNAYRERALGS